MHTGEDLKTLFSCIQDCIGPFAGRVEYGNLRSRVSDWDCGDGEPITNVALVYETPGGSTDQINITYYHKSGTFALIDAEEGEVMTPSIDLVLKNIQPRISGIPSKRRETLYAEIRRQVDSGSNTAGLFGHLNRLMQSEFKGGTITHLELRDAMTYAMQYMKGQNSGAARDLTPS
jgi:hypothetical protein